VLGIPITHHSDIERRIRVLGSRIFPVRGSLLERWPNVSVLVLTGATEIYQDGLEESGSDHPCLTGQDSALTAQSTQAEVVTGGAQAVQGVDNACRGRESPAYTADGE
jgi:hypothetical protein